MLKPSLLLGLLAGGLALAGIATRNGGLLALTLPLLAYLAAGLLFEPPAPQLAITRTINPDRVAAGEPVTVTVSITNTGQPLDEVEVIDALPARLELVAGQPRLRASLAAGESILMQYTVTARRGLYRLDELQAVAGETLGLFWQAGEATAAAQFFVLPAVTRLRRVAIRPPRTGIYSGLVPARQGGPGVEFFGVRDYHPGDPTRWINQRATARRHQRIFVNEFEQERVVDVGLILDARQQSDSPVGAESLFEYSVEAAAALADSLLNSGNRVGLFIYGRSLDWTFPGYGKMQRERILRALARAEQGGGSVFEKLDHLPTQLFPVRSQLVLISPLLPQDPEMLVRLRARGYRLLVISPDPISFEQPQLAPGPHIELAVRLARLERALTLKQLREADIQVVDWPVATPFHQIAGQTLSRIYLQQGGGGL